MFSKRLLWLCVQGFCEHRCVTGVKVLVDIFLINSTIIVGCRYVGFQFVNVSGFFFILVMTTVLSFACQQNSYDHFSPTHPTTNPLPHRSSTTRIDSTLHRQVTPNMFFLQQMLLGLAVEFGSRQVGADKWLCFVRKSLSFSHYNFTRTVAHREIFYHFIALGDSETSSIFDVHKSVFLWPQQSRPVSKVPW